MRTRRQEALAEAFLSALEDEVRPAFQAVVDCLAELGYHPQKDRSNLSFKHALHNKQVAKMGVHAHKGATPFFALRFSACGGYSQRFADVVAAAAGKYPNHAARCTEGGCGYCAGAAAGHVYTHTLPDGERKHLCGAYALEIPDISADDVGEIKKLIREEHAYLLAHEANAAEA